MKKNLFLKIMFLSFSSVLIITCAKYKKNPVGAEFFNRDDMGEEKSCLLYASSDTSFHYSNIKTGKSKSIYMGSIENHNIQAFTLLKFENLPDTFQFDSASINLFIKNFYEKETDIFSCSLYLISQNWDENELAYKDYNEGFKGSFIKDYTVSSVKDTLTKNISVSLPEDIVQTWADTNTSDNNYGILLVPNNSQFITEFYSSEADSNQPELHLFTHTDTTDLEFIRTSSHDLFFAEGEFLPEANELYIANGTGIRSLLYFDVSLIPEQATINKAYLNIYSDTTSAFPDWRNTFSISIFQTADLSWPTPDVPLDSSNYVSLSLKSDSSTADITVFTQQWTSMLEENAGLLLKGLDESRNLYYRKLFSSKADSSRMPFLKIYYSIPPENNL